MKAKHKTGLVFFPAYDWAISPSHPERQERLLYTQDQLMEEGIQDIEGLTMVRPVPCTNADIERVHFAVPNVAQRLTDSHKVSVGGAITAYDLVFSGEVQRSFALIRPPGHHAHRIVYGDRGFCIVNNEAIALEAMRQRYGDLRVAIVDTDCHHGDGTQDIYWNDPDTLVINVHQDGRTLFPGTGHLDERGGPGAYGLTVNVPLPPGTGEEGFLSVLENVIMPILESYEPDLIINSAGQDNHYSDPLTSMNFTAQGYAKLTERLAPDIAVLEGGYSIEGALPYVNLGIVAALAGLDYSKIREPNYDSLRLKQSPILTRKIHRIEEQVMDQWHQRDREAHQKFQGQDFVRVPKHIFYDTDRILEEQVTMYRVCNHCAGYHVIQSTNGRELQVLAIHVPRKACDRCRNEALRRFENAESRYSHVYLQDRPTDRYLRK